MNESFSKFKCLINVDKKVEHNWTRKNITYCIYYVYNNLKKIININESF
jgi:hypothetical protein